MFIGRGLKQKNPVATSSLIFVVKKSSANESHKVTIVNYKDYNEPEFEKYLRGRNKETKTILQAELLKNIKNWNFIKQNDTFIRMYDSYLETTQDMSNYYEHDSARKTYNSTFYFDGGYSIDEKQLLNAPDFYIYPEINNNYYTIRDARGFWPNIRQGNSKHRIDLRQGNQEYHLLDSEYKIIWSYANMQRFFFTDKPVIWARNQFNAIGSNNKSELLYLFSLLNSSLNFCILKSMLKSENEKDFLIATNSVKQFIRAPIINQNNQIIKDEIIKQTEIMLNLETSSMSNYVDFGNIQMQKFDRVEFDNKNLILYKENNRILAKIKSNPELIKQIIADKYSEKNLAGNPIISLTELKSTPVIDCNEQESVKDYIDTLVFALYFNIKLSKVGFEYAKRIKTKCKGNKFYTYIESGEQ